MQNQKILHLICCEKFTTAYINFMVLELSEYEHIFVVYGDKYDVKPIESANVTRISSYRKLLEYRSVRTFLKSADKIIVSGVFGIERYMIGLPQKIWNKTFLQFWGGDIYSYRATHTIKEKIYKMIVQLAIRRCKAVLNLISEDYPELVKVFRVEKAHYTAEMPEDPLSVNRCKLLRTTTNNKVSHEKRKIILGNSATKENQHAAILKILRNVLGNNTQVLCPLSYGDRAYANEVCNIGQECLGERFIPLTSYMAYDQYVELLAECDVGIYNNNRQQAMGNIWLLAKLGKKIYIREDTPMWEHFKNWGLILYDAATIEHITEEELFFYTDEERQQNYRVMDSKVSSFICNWKQVLK